MPSGTSTPEEFLRKRKLPVATYFALALNFSYPVLEILLFFVDPEEEVTMKKWSVGPIANMESVKMKGRWIQVGRAEWIFLFSKPGLVFVSNWESASCEARVVSLGQEVIIGDQRVVSKSLLPNITVEYHKNWCMTSSRKFYDGSELVEINENGFSYMGFKK